MARIYLVTRLSADLTGGDDFDFLLMPARNQTGTQRIDVAANSTHTSYLFTPAGHPGLSANPVGSFPNNPAEFRINITTASTNVSLVVRASRINSTGTVQTGPVNSDTGSVSLGTTGVKTFNWDQFSLGTFASTDRLRLDLAFTSTAPHSQSRVDFGEAGSLLRINNWVTRFYSVS